MAGWIAVVPGVAILVLILVVWLGLRQLKRRAATAWGLGSRVQHAILVTAHPDDECMFFAPTIRTMLANGVDVRIVCLSTGEFT